MYIVNTIHIYNRALLFRICVIGLGSQFLISRRKLHK
jgi:hypothetical protein